MRDYSKVFERCIEIAKPHLPKFAERLQTTLDDSYFDAPEIRDRRAFVKLMLLCQQELPSPSIGPPWVKEISDVVEGRAPGFEA
jgi:hypothetical protein